jgi:hypothetical protein
MQITSHVDELQRRLVAAAAAGTPEAQEIAGRLVDALDAAVRLTVLEALADAAGEITRELAPGSVDVRLRGRDIDFVVAAPASEGARTTPGAASAPANADDVEDASSTRTTLRMPDALKSRAEAAAAAEGISLNTWLVRAVGTALDPRAEPGSQASGSGYTGWVR